MRYILLIISLLLISPSSVGAKDTPKITLDKVSEISESVYKIRCYMRGGTFSQGSGFVISGMLITNFHVAGNAESFEISQNGETVVKTVDDVVFANEDKDIMGIKFDGKELKTSSKKPSYGDRVYTMGYPLNKFKMSEGNVRFVIQKNGMVIIISNVKIDSGSSGSILFNDAGEIIGIISRALDNGYAEAIPISYVEKELR